MTDPNTISDAVLWVQSALLGSVATIIATIAVAVIGLLMLGGRLDAQRGIRTVLGCFLVFGAPTIAAAFMALGQGATSAPAARAPERAVVLPTVPPAAPYDPYAGASVPSRP